MTDISIEEIYKYISEFMVIQSRYPIIMNFDLNNLFIHCYIVFIMLSLEIAHSYGTAFI